MVLVTGMGGELGTRVTNLLEADERDRGTSSASTSIRPGAGCIAPSSTGSTHATGASSCGSSATSSRPPSSISACTSPTRGVGPALARELTHRVHGHRARSGRGESRRSTASSCVPESRSTAAVAGAADRARTSPSLPEPTSPFGRSLLEMESMAREVGRGGRRSGDRPAVRSDRRAAHGRARSGASCDCPSCPVALLSDLPFSLLHQRDAAAAPSRARSTAGFDGPVNVVAPGAVTPIQAARIGGRVGAPARSARRGCSRGARPRCSGRRCPLTFVSCSCAGERPTDRFGREDPRLCCRRTRRRKSCKDLYEWASVTYLEQARRRRPRERADVASSPARRVLHRRRVGARPRISSQLVSPAARRAVAGRRSTATSRAGDWARPAGVQPPFRFVGAVRRRLAGRSGRRRAGTSASRACPMSRRSVPPLRRFGAVLARPDEVGGLLRADQLVGVGLRASPRRRQLAGTAPAPLLAPALATGAAVLPVAVTGREIGRSWRLWIGPAIEHPDEQRPAAPPRSSATESGPAYRRCSTMPSLLADSGVERHAATR